MLVPILGALTIYGGLAGVVALFGPVDAGVAYLFVVFIILTLLVAAFYTKPKILNAASYALSDIDLSDLMSFRGIERVIGLVGVTNVGKTTFLETLSSRPYSNRQSETSYFVILPIKNTVRKSKHIAIIDSVGQSYNNQFRTPEYSDVLVLFLDHSDGTVDSFERIESQRRFVTQLMRSIKENGARIKRCVVVLNKYDILPRDKAAALLAEYNSTMQELQSFALFEHVEFILDYSNHQHNKVVRLLEICMAPLSKRASSK